MKSRKVKSEDEIVAQVHVGGESPWGGRADRKGQRGAKPSTAGGEADRGRDIRPSGLRLRALTQKTKSTRYGARSEASRSPFSQMEDDQTA